MLNYDYNKLKRILNNELTSYYLTDEQLLRAIHPLFCLKTIVCLLFQCPRDYGSGFLL